MLIQIKSKVKKMDDEQFYRVYTVPKDGFGLYCYLFKYKIMDAWLEPENRTKLENAFYKASGIDPTEEPIVNIDQSKIISVIYDQKS